MKRALKEERGSSRRLTLSPVYGTSSCSNARKRLLPALYEPMRTGASGADPLRAEALAAARNLQIRHPRASPSGADELLPRIDCIHKSISPLMTAAPCSVGAACQEKKAVMQAGGGGAAAAPN